MQKILKHFFSLSLVCFALTACQSVPPNGKPEILSVKKIWDAGQHNAFTDLIRLQGKWFCTFREADAHVGGDGKIRVLVSHNGEQWRSAALLSETGVDLRDPKFSITPEKQLMLVMGGSIYEGKKLLGKQPRVAFSNDGANWSHPQKVLHEGDWLWRVTWHKGRAYGIVYSSVKDAVRDWKLSLAESDDGIHFHKTTKLDVSGSPNEATLRFQKNGDAIALVRRESLDKVAWIGTSSAPYKDWNWTPSNMQVGGPNFIILKDGSMIASGRQYRNANWNESKTFVGRMGLRNVQPEIILPSGGDTSYAGMILEKGILWVSYYSSHEGKTSIYLAKVKF